MKKLLYYLFIYFYKHSFGVEITVRLPQMGYDINTELLLVIIYLGHLFVFLNSFLKR